VEEQVPESSDGGLSDGFSKIGLTLFGNARNTVISLIHAAKVDDSLDTSNFSLFDEGRVTLLLTGPWDKDLVSSEMTSSSMVLTVLYIP
jgi:hypothetical protein